MQLHTVDSTLSPVMPSPDTPDLQPLPRLSWIAAFTTVTAGSV